MGTLWTISTALFSIADVVANTFINFYIWENTKDFSVLLRYNIFLFTFVPAGALLFGYIAKRTSLRLSYSLGVLMRCVQLTLVIIKGPEALDILLLFGMISGAASGAHIFAFNTINQKSTTIENRDKLFGIQNAQASLVKLIVPPALAFVVSYTGSYDNIFIPAIIIFMAASILGLSVKVDVKKGKYQIEEVMRLPGTNPDKKIIFNALLINGMRSSLMIAIFPVLTLIILGGRLINWGLFTLLLTSFSVVTSYIYGRLTNIKTSKYIFLFSGFFFSMASIVFALHFNLYSLIAFSISLAILDIVLGVSFESDIDTLSEQDSKIEELIAEYNVFTEIPTALGKLLPLMALYFLDISLQNDLYLRIAFLIVGALPLTILSILGKSPLLSEDTV